MKGKPQINKKVVLRKAKEKGIPTEGRDIADIFIDIVNSYPQFKAKRIP